MIDVDVDAVVGLLRRVGDGIVEWQASSEMRILSDVHAYKTRADLEAHEEICKGLRRIDSSMPIISEEDQCREPGRPNRYWLVDPIDGTRSWREGYVGYATQVAYIKEGISMVGIVHAPEAKKTWIGVAGSGAKLNGRWLKKRKATQRKVIVDNYPEPYGVAKSLMSCLPGTGYVESGSIGVKCCLVADGTADLFVKDVTVRDWDIAPAMPVLEAVGGSVLCGNGENFQLNGSIEKTSGVIVASDWRLARQAARIMAAGRLGD